MVRPATKDDSGELARMLEEFNLEYEEPTPGVAVLEPRVRDFISRELKTYLVAVEGDSVVGFAQVDFHVSIWSGTPVGFLDELYVVPDRRGNGFGRSLMEAYVALAHERGAAGVEVVTGEDDTAARCLYESFGMQNEIEGPQSTRSLFYELDFD